MSTILRRLLVITPLAFFALVFSFTAVRAGGMSVSPDSGGFDTSFDVSGDGFFRNEPVSLWVTTPRLQTIGLGETTADSGGSIEFSIQPQTEWGSGHYIAVAEGQRSHIQLSAGFGVNTGGGGPNGENPYPPCGCQAQFLGSPGGLAVNYNAQGFAGSEPVMVWVKDPAANVHRLPNVTPDPWGNLVFVFSLTPDSLYGPYYITATGINSGHFTYNTLTFWGGIINQRSSDPISRATPTYNFNPSGFTPGESVTIRLYDPDGVPKILTTLPATDGSIQYSYILPPGSPLGTYGMAATGATSGHKVTGQFTWDGVLTPIP